VLRTACASGCGATGCRPVAEENAREAERNAEDAERNAQQARAATTLAEQRAAEVEAEKERVAAERDRADSENRRFRLVRYTLDLDDAEAEFGALHPDPETWARDWAAIAPDLERWLTARGEALIDARVEVRQALDELRARALPPSAEDAARIEAWRAERILPLQQQRSCWNRAVALAAGTVTLELPSLDEVVGRIAGMTNGSDAESGPRASSTTALPGRGWRWR
jgi:hypothetical protein